jgi:hypothetical protein
MNTYKITIAENISHRQFVGYIEAETETEAKEKAKKEFIAEKPLYDAHFKIIMCHKMQQF